MTISTFGYANSAVSELNGSLGAAAGSFSSQNGKTYQGSVTFPIADALGFQFDGYYADIDDADAFGGIGAHLFWRDNEVGLLGLSAGAVEGDFVKTYEFSVEAEYYFNQFTFGARAGYAEIEYDFTVPYIDSDKWGAYGKAYVGFYAFDDLWVSASVENRFENTNYGVDIEYQTPIDGLSLFGNASKGNDDYDHAYVGLRYYFGGKKSLKGRHRRDDPKNMLIDMLTGIGTYGAETNMRAEKYFKKLRKEWNDYITSGGSISGSGSLTLDTGSTLSSGSLVVVGPNTYTGSGSIGGTLGAGWNLGNTYTGDTGVLLHDGTLILNGSSGLLGVSNLVGAVPAYDGSIYTIINDVGSLNFISSDVLSAGSISYFQDGSFELIVVGE